MHTQYVAAHRSPTSSFASLRSQKFQPRRKQYLLSPLQPMVGPSYSQDNLTSSLRNIASPRTRNRSTIYRRQSCQRTSKPSSQQRRLQHLPRVVVGKSTMLKSSLLLIQSRSQQSLRLQVSISKQTCGQGMGPVRMTPLYVRGDV